MKATPCLLKKATLRGMRSILRKTATAAAIAGALALNADAAVTNTWAVDADGLWTNEANWATATVPADTGDVANLTFPLTANRNVTLDAPITLGELHVGTKTCTYKLQSTGDGALTLKGLGDAPAVLEQMRGSETCNWELNCGYNLESDVDIRLHGGGYTKFGSFIGGHDIHLNRGGGNQTLYAVASSPNFTGNWHIHAGTLMTAGEPFGSTGSGTRTITIYNNATLRNNGNAIIRPNRRIVIDASGGKIMPNGREMRLDSADQFAGSGNMTLTDASNWGGSFTLNAANDNFTGAIIAGNDSVVANFGLGENGSISNSPLILLANNVASLIVDAKPDGYDVPAGQTVAGVGGVRGKLNVTTAGATVHPGSYTLPGPAAAPGILAVTNGLAIANGGTYLWTLKSLKDDATGVAGADFSRLDVGAGGVGLAGGVLTLNFTGDAAASGPDSTDAFWKTDHTWTILTADAPPSGKLVVSNGKWKNGTFLAQVSGNDLELTYRQGFDTTLIMVR
ncbi:MAG: hypothetical protein ACOX9C_07475 [Kiritimatiellia bacterium]|jgi:hypothetical protein